MKHWKIPTYDRVRGPRLLAESSYTQSLSSRSHRWQISHPLLEGEHFALALVHVLHAFRFLTSPGSIWSNWNGETKKKCVKGLPMLTEVFHGILKRGGAE